ncbi:MAG: hypothetical protein JWM36_4343 [Hyphomicrobiales bacterium]|nr:hypothetical protein [Hyphomicrobiales bacterium]
MRLPFRFAQSFDHAIRPGLVIAYKAGHELIIPRDHANAAIQAGAGDYVQTNEKVEPDASSRKPSGQGPL